MEYMKLIENRYSVRKYRAEQPDGEAIAQILEAARLAPTAHNYQPQEIIAVTSTEGLALLNKCTECRYGAPLAFIVCYNKNRAWKREYDGKCSGDVDAAIVTTHMMLAAESLGIGTTWIMYFIPEAVKTEFDLPEEIEPAAILYMGYADDKPSPAHFSRRELNEYVTYR